MAGGEHEEREAARDGGAVPGGALGDNDQAASAPATSSAPSAAPIAARAARDAECPHPLHRRGQRRLVVPAPDSDAEPLEAAAQLLPAEQPEPVGEQVDSLSPGSTNGTGETSMREVSPARGGRAGPPRILDRAASGDDECLGRQHARRDHVDVLPGVAELHLGLEHGVDEAVTLLQPAPGHQPAEHAAEGDQSDAVAAVERHRGDGRRRPHGAVERALLERACLREAVGEDDLVGVHSGWRSFTTSSPRRALARQLIERRRSPGIGPRVRELQAVTLHSGHLVAGDAWVSSGAIVRCSRSGLG